MKNEAEQGKKENTRTVILQRRKKIGSRKIVILMGTTSIRDKGYEMRIE